MEVDRLEKLEHDKTANRGVTVISDGLELVTAEANRTSLPDLSDMCPGRCAQITILIKLTLIQKKGLKLDSEYIILLHTS